MGKKQKLTMIFMVLKYLFSLILIALTYVVIKSKGTVVISGLELLMIALLTNALAGRHLRLARIVNDILILLLNIQLISLFFGGDFITLVMLTNVSSIEDLSGKFVVYGLGVFLILLFSFLPIRYVRMNIVSSSTLLAAVLAAELALTMMFGTDNSPFYHYYSLARDVKEYWDLQRQLASMPDQTEEFYKTRVDQYMNKPDSLPEQPNIIVIFAEGLSSNIVNDERGVMPNVRDLESKSINFTNYYNHTFATYRALIGQLYSGYQLDNLDTNTLTSLQSELKDQGYQTAFINTEPKNMQFTEYLETFGFDDVISDRSLDAGATGSLSDKQAFDKLYETMEASDGEPFFIGMYTFGTHIATDSPDQKFGDGKSAILNRFYNLDYQFGAFMDRFDKSEYADNTIVVFTADHATYAENEYNRVFPHEPRIDAVLDQMPLMIYHNGVVAQNVDAKGRNTIDFTPTILDYIDVSDDNYFLGTSLFSPITNANNFDTVFYDATRIYLTKDAQPRELTADEFDIVMPMITNYFAAKTQTPRH